jgi:transposase, IS6 family
MLGTRSSGKGSVALPDEVLGQGGPMRRRHVQLPPPRSSFAGFRFPREVMVLAERGIEVDHVTVYRWVQRFTPLLIDAARPCRHARGDRWFVEETHVKIAGRWVYLYRAIDQSGQFIDVLVSQKRDMATTHRFVTRAPEHGPSPTTVTTDRAAADLWVLDELVPAARQVIER